VAEEFTLTRIEAALRRTQADLSELGLRWALVGGFAVSARAVPRFTRDLDLAVAVPHDKAAEALVASLVARGYRVVAVVEQTAVSRLATVRLVPPGESEQGVVVDLLFASSGIEVEIVAAADTIEVLPSLMVPVAKGGHLLALKVLSRDDDERPQDAADIHRWTLHRRRASGCGSRSADPAPRVQPFPRDRRRRPYGARIAPPTSGPGSHLIVAAPSRRCL
jgi:hypothetical protein